MLLKSYKAFIKFVPDYPKIKFIKKKILITDDQLKLQFIKLTPKLDLDYKKTHLTKMPRCVFNQPNQSLCDVFLVVVYLDMGF